MQPATHLHFLGWRVLGGAAGSWEVKATLVCLLGGAVGGRADWTQSEPKDLREAMGNLHSFSGSVITIMVFIAIIISHMQQSVRMQRSHVCRTISEMPRRSGSLC